MQRCFGTETPASKSELSPNGSGFIGTDSRKPRSGSGSDVPVPPSPPPEVSDGVEAGPMRAILPAGREVGGLSEPPPHRWTLRGQNSDPVLLLHRRSMFAERWRRRVSC